MDARLEASVTGSALNTVGFGIRHSGCSPNAGPASGPALGEQPLWLIRKHVWIQCMWLMETQFGIWSGSGGRNDGARMGGGWWWKWNWDLNAIPSYLHQWLRLTWIETNASQTHSGRAKPSDVFAFSQKNIDWCVSNVWVPNKAPIENYTMYTFLNAGHFYTFKLVIRPTSAMPASNEWKTTRNNEELKEVILVPAYNNCFLSWIVSVV